MADFTNIHTLIDETIYPNEHQEINATDHNAMLHEQLDAIEDAIDLTETFVATAGTTAYGDIAAALAAGKDVVCEATIDGKTYTLPYVYTGDTAAVFGAMANTDLVRAQVTIVGSAWMKQIIPMASDSELAAGLALKEDKHFVATYGTTTLAEINAAHDAGKIIVCVNGSAKAALVSINSGQAQFATPSAAGVTMYAVLNNGWISQSFTYVQAEEGKGLSTNDYTNADKEKLTALPTASQLATDLAGKEDKHFVAVKGRTTAAEVYAAFTAGKRIVAQEDGIEYALVSSTSSKAIFQRADKENIYALAVSGMIWTKSTTTLATELALEGKVDTSAIKQTAGTSTTDLMSQKATTDALGGKVDKVTGKGLSTNDYTDEEKAQNAQNKTDIAEAQRDIKAFKAQTDVLGHAHAIDIDTEFGYKRNNRGVVIYGAGAPSATTIPDQAGVPMFVGQLYIDTTATERGLWYGIGTTAVSEWKKA